ncbi:MAG: S41 family peptidase [Lentisphaeria bacterium]|nr:S41 family peptidase [Lentisphaeria bacterium]
MKNLLYVIVAALLIGNAAFGYRVYCKETPKDSKEVMEKLELFMEVFQQVRANYVDAEDIKIDDLFNNAIKGMVYSLDPFSEYMTPSEFKDFQEQEQDSFGGIGVQVQMRDSYLTVSSPMKGTPAAQAGILSGDQIIAIDGEDQTGKSTDEVIRKLRGEPGSAVTLTIKRPEEPEPLEITLKRMKIENPSINDIHVIEGTKTGYLRVEWFAEPTAKQFEKALQTLEDEGIDSLVIDLRNNPGGRVDVCVGILNFLLPPNSLVATLEGRDPKNQTSYSTRGTPYHFPDTIPIAVLGNRGTASAAEITISSLRDYHRAVFIGERTFGKALVQDVMDLGGGHAVKFTVAKYYTKLRTPIQGRGIRPDIRSRLSRHDFIAINNADGMAAADKIDPNIQAALKFFAEGAQWPVYEGEKEGDYADVLPQWQRDENRHYRLYDYDIYGTETVDPADKAETTTPQENM